MGPIDVTPSLGDELVREEMIGWYGEMIRVPDVPREVGVRELLGLDQEMQIRRRVVSERQEVVRLEHLEHLERGDALVVRRKLPYPVALEVDGDRRDPRGLIFSQVLHGEEAAQLVDARHDLRA